MEIRREVKFAQQQMVLLDHLEREGKFGHD
jgi:hypothetical protein